VVVASFAALVAFRVSSFALITGGVRFAAGSIHRKKLVGVLAKRPGLAWLNNFVMAFSMLGGLISSLAWVRIFG